MAELKEIVDAEENKVFLFTKEGCVYCVQALEVFAGLGVTTVVADIAAADPAVKAALAPADGAALTMPQVFVGGKRVGGCGELLAEQESGALFGRLSAANVELPADGAASKLTDAQLTAARQAMVPDPYVESSLAARGILYGVGAGPTAWELPAALENLYSLDAATGELKVSYTESNKCYKSQPDDAALRVRDQEEAKSERTMAVTLALDPSKLAGQPAFDIELDLPEHGVDMWGSRFVGTATIIHPDGARCAIYLPGVLTFDPAGITGDSHASERIGPSCARVQTAINVAQLYALQKGGSAADVDAIQDASEEIIFWFNGRLSQWKWCRQQIREACELKKAEVTPYPVFIRELAEKGELNLEFENRAPTREFLETFEQGGSVPPMAFFVKVNEKGCSCFA